MVLNLYLYESNPRKNGYKTKYKLIFFYFDSEEISKYCVHENDTCTNWLTRSMYTVIVLVY